MGGSCGVETDTSNNIPTVDAGRSFIIPRNTPFTLTATGTDADERDIPNLTFVWEQLNAGGTHFANPPYLDARDPPVTTRPLFRVFPPTPSPSRTFPSLTYILKNANVPPETVGGLQTAENLPNVSRALNFRCTVRDSRGGVNDDSVALIVIAGAGPFAVTQPNTTAVTWDSNSTQTVTWDVANTNNAPVSAADVKISLSTDGGNTFPTVLLASTPNDGSEEITVPETAFTDLARIKVEAVDNIFFDISDTDFTINPPPVTTGVIISEFRFRGPGGSGDEFVELYNTTNAPIDIGGWAIVAQTGVEAPEGKFIANAGARIPARGHILVVGLAYSLGPYTMFDDSLASGIVDGSGIALFSSRRTFTAATRLDAVGFTSATDPLYREGVGLTPNGGITTDGEYSFARRLVAGVPRDTGNNAADFDFVSTTGGTFSIKTSVLGAPGPENRHSPVAGGGIATSLIDPHQPESQPPNRVRTPCPSEGTCGANRQFGTLSIRRKFTNNTGTDVTHLRFRIIDITTRNNRTGAQADLRALSSGTFTYRVTGEMGTQTGQGTTLETPPDQPNGGGLNSSLTVIPPQRALAPGASINLQFLLGVERNGSDRFIVVVEALPSSTSSIPVDTSFNPGANGSVFTIAVQTNGSVLVGGNFTKLGGGTATTERNHIGRLFPDGTLDPDFDPRANGSVYAIAVQADRSILVGGNFTMLGGQPRNRIGRLRENGSLRSFDPGADGTVRTIIVEANQDILVGGAFTRLGGRTRNRIGRLKLENDRLDLDLSFDPGADGEVFTIAVQANRDILVGGQFSMLGGDPRWLIGRLRENGILDPNFDPGACCGPVRTIVVQVNQDILVGGAFTQLGGGGQGTRRRSRIGQLDRNGRLTNFDPGANRVVRAIVVQADGKILVGGGFQTLGGGGRGTTVRFFIGRLDPIDGGITNFNPGANDHIRTILVQANRDILVGGAFTWLGGGGTGTTMRNRIGRLTNTAAALQNPPRHQFYHPLVMQRR